MSIWLLLLISSHRTIIHQTTAHPYQVDQIGDGDTNFRPVDLYMNSTHFIAPDDWDGEIEVWSRDGSFVSKFGINNFTAGWMGGIHVYNSRIYAVAIDSGIILEYDENGNYLSEFATGRPFQTFDVFHNSTHIFTSHNAAVRIWDTNGNQVDIIGGTSAGSAFGNFSQARGILVNSTHIHVADRSNNRIQIFDLAGNFVTYFNTTEFTVPGGPGLKNVEPWGLTITSHYYVTTHLDHLNFYDFSGNYQFTIGEAGTEYDQFGDTRSIINNGTHLFTSGQGSPGRIQFFKITPDFTSTVTNTVTQTETSTETQTETQTDTVTETQTETTTQNTTITQTQTNTVTQTETTTQNNTITQDTTVTLTEELPAVTTTETSTTTETNYNTIIERSTITDHTTILSTIVNTTTESSEGGLPYLGFITVIGLLSVSRVYRRKNH